MTESLDESYLIWLYSQVCDVKVRNRSRTYWRIFRQMQEKHFVWFVPNDDNRVQDGIDLRHEWAAATEAYAEPVLLDNGCTFLEMLVALSRRLAFEGEGHPPVWFWHLMTNLGLQHCTDQSGYNPAEVEDVLDTVIFRTYEPNGRGGLFPLKNAMHDQREVEIWYQLNEYLLSA